MGACFESMAVLWVASGNMAVSLLCRELLVGVSVDTVAVWLFYRVALVVVLWYMVAV